ncbi:MAG: hypothetical protein RJA09_1908 [Pseudomonadota bacterium]
MNGSPPDREVERLQGLNTTGVISYVLHLVVAVGALIPGGQWGPTLLVVAVVLDLVKRGDAQGTWHASHIRWRLRTVVFALIAYILTAPLWLLLLWPGWLAWLVIGVWFVYRVVKGMVRLNAGQPMEFSQ